MSSLGDRIRETREASGLTAASFSRKIGVAVHRVRDVERGKQRAPEDLLVAVVENFQVDANWLLLGEGPMYRGQGEASPATSTSGGLREVLAAEGRAAEAELGLGEVASLARLGAGAGQWQVIELLIERHPVPVSLDELVGATGVDASTMGGYLTLLVRQGVVTKAGSASYQIHDSWAELRSVSAPDVSQHGLAALERLLKVILPASEAGRGVLVTAVLKLGAGEGANLTDELIDAVRRLCRDAAAAPGDDETYTLVVGLAPEGSGSYPRKPSHRGTSGAG